MTEFTALTDEEKAIHDEFFAPEGFVLMRAVLDGQQVAVVTVVSQDTSDDYHIAPVAILVTDSIMDRLDPGEDVEMTVLSRKDDGDGMGLVVLGVNPKGGGDSDTGSGEASGGSQHPGHGS